MIPLLAAVAVLLLTSLAEWLHARRIRAVGRLAFGPTGVPNRWTRVVPFLRPFCLSAFTWGLATLLFLKIAPAEGSGGKDGGGKEATRLVFVADLSPSMYLKDAGPEGTQTRQARMREVVEAILQRVGGNLRFGVLSQLSLRSRSRMVSSVPTAANTTAGRSGSTGNRSVQTPPSSAPAAKQSKINDPTVACPRSLGSVSPRAS